MLPQKFPFAFLDHEGDDDGVRVLLTAGGRPHRSRPLAQGLALEMLAQAALIELVRPPAKDPDGADDSSGEPAGQPAIAGFDDVSYSEAWARRPPSPGEQLRAKTELLGRFGPMLKVKGRLHRQEPGQDDEMMLEATLLLVAPK